MEVSQSETRLTEFFSSFFSSQQSTDQTQPSHRPMNKTGSDSQLLVNHNTSGNHVGGPRDHTRGASVNGLDPAILGVNGGQLSNTSSNNNKLSEKRSSGEKKKKGYWYNVSILYFLFMFFNGFIWILFILNWILYPSKHSWVEKVCI